MAHFDMLAECQIRAVRDVYRAQKSGLTAPECLQSLTDVWDDSASWNDVFGALVNLHFGNLEGGSGLPPCGGH